MITAARHSPQDTQQRNKKERFCRLNRQEQGETSDESCYPHWIPANSNEIHTGEEGNSRGATRQLRWLLLLQGNTLLPRSTRCHAAARYGQSAFALHVGALPCSSTLSRDPGMVTPFQRHEVDFKTSAPFPWCQPKPCQHPLGYHSCIWASQAPLPRLPG